MSERLVSGETPVEFFREQLGKAMEHQRVATSAFTEFYLVNLLAADEIFPADRRLYDPALPGNEKVVFPEYPTCGDKSAEIAGHAIGWLTDEPSRQAVIHRLEDLRSRFAGGGASQRTADYLLKHLVPRTSIPSHHFDTRSEDPIRWRKVADRS